jgi:SAM-dependent methyltransferase
MNTNGNPNSDGYEEYFNYLQKISWRGRIYKRYVSSSILYFCANRFGRRIAEVGSGTGSGILGAFPSRVVGLEINPFAVKYTKSIGVNALLLTSR